MKNRLSILRIYSIIFLTVCFAFTIYNYRQLSEAEGWGMVGMIGLAGLGLILFVVDIVIWNLIRNRWIANLLGLVIALLVTVAIIWEDHFF
jgi:hypothetical protein